MLTLKQANTGFMPGVYINRGRIISANDLSGKPTYGDNPESIRDLAIEVEIDIGKDWTKKVIIKGNLKTDPNNIKSIDWGSAFVIKDFFMKTGCFRGLTEEEIKDKLKVFSRKDIPPDFLLKIRGKEVFVVDYIKGISDDGKVKYATWNIVDTNEEKLKAAFIASARKGYPFNYQPGLLTSTEVDTSFRYGANAEQPVNQGKTANQESSEDDFPF